MMVTGQQSSDRYYAARDSNRLVHWHTAKQCVVVLVDDRHLQHSQTVSAVADCVCTVNAFLEY